MDPTAYLLEELERNWNSGNKLLTDELQNGFRASFTPHEMRVAAAHLQRVFTPQRLSDAIQGDSLPSQVQSLFVKGWNLFLWEMVLLGLDVDVVAEYGFYEDREMVAGLCRRDSFFQRRVELGIWAGLVRSHMEVERVQETKKTRTPDFEVKVEAQKYLIEVKVVGDGQYDDMVARLKNTWSFSLTRSRDGLDSSLVFGKHVSFYASGGARAALQNTATRATAFKELTACLDEAAEHIFTALMQGTQLPFEYQMSTFGCVRVSDNGNPNGSSMELVGLRPTPLLKQAKRLIQRVHDNVDQVCHDGFGVFVLHCSRQLPATAMTQLLTIFEEAAFGGPPGADAIVITNQFRSLETGEIVKTRGAVVSQSSELKRVPDALLNAVCNWRYTC